MAEAIPVLVRLELKLRWMYCWDPKAQMYVAVCDPLGLTAGGETFDDVCAEIKESIELLFQDLLTTGDLADFLTRKNWKHLVPRIPTGQPVKFDVPFGLIEAKKPRDIARGCHAA